MDYSHNDSGLKRDLGFFSATALVVANMVGTGIFTTSGFIMAELGDPRALLLCWVFGGVFALCGALCYGELGARFPRAGGEYVFLRESLGPPVGFLSGWISLIVGFSAPIAAAAVALATYGFRVFSISGTSDWTLTIAGTPIIAISPLTLTAIAAIVVFSLIHCHSLRIGSRVQNALTVFKITLVVVFIGAGLWVGDGSTDHLAPMPSAVWSAEKFAVALIFVSFAYSGWNAAAYLGAEIKRPEKTIPRALFTGTAIVALLYLLLNLVYLIALPPESMQGVLEIGANAATALFGTGISRLFSAAVAIGLLSVLGAMIMTGPRIYYAMAADGIFFDLFGRLDPARRTPAAAIFLQAGIAIVMVVSASFEALLLYIGFTLSLFTLLTVIGLMRIRHTAPARTTAYTTFGYPVTPLFYILGNLWIIVFCIRSRPAAALYGLGTIGLGILAYLFFQRRHRSRPEVIFAGRTVSVDD